MEGAGLAGVDLNQADLRGSNLKAVNLRNANLSGAKLGGEDPKLVDLGDNRFRKTILQGANLEGANLVRADLGGACLEGANLKSVNLFGANLRMARLNRANLSRSFVGGTYRSKVAILAADLLGRSFYTRTLTDTKWVAGNYVAAYRNGAKIIKAKPTFTSRFQALLVRTDLSFADLREAELSGVDFTGAVLTSSNLTDANLTDAKLLKACVRKYEDDFTQPIWPMDFDGPVLPDSSRFFTWLTNRREALDGKLESLK